MSNNQPIGQILQTFFDKLLVAIGPQRWWPGETRTEMIVGAILTQNTSWTNVERAIERLKRAELLTLPALHAVDEPELAETIRPAGTYRIKAKRLKAFVGWLEQTYGGVLDRMFAADPTLLRKQLLTVQGIGPETADAILLYAGGVATFVVDAYTQRILRRHFLIDAYADYAQTKALFENHLTKDAAMFGEFHALLVATGKHFCRKTAQCDACPLNGYEHDAAL